MCRRASSLRLVWKSHPLTPQFRGRCWQWFTWTLRSPFLIFCIQNGQLTGSWSTSRRMPYSICSLKGVALQKGHSWSWATCRSHRNCLHWMQWTAFSTTSKHTGHSIVVNGKLGGTASTNKIAVLQYCNYMYEYSNTFFFSNLLMNHLTNEESYWSVQLNGRKFLYHSKGLDVISTLIKY